MRHLRLLVVWKWLLAPDERQVNTSTVPVMRFGDR